MHALLVLVCEVVGRFVYTATSLTAASVVLGAAGALWLHRGGDSGLRQLAAAPRVLRAAGGWMVPFLIVWLATILFSVVAVVTVPPLTPDVLRYHLPMGVSWLQLERVAIDPLADYRVNHFPHNVNLLNAWALVLTRNWRLVGLPQVVLSGLLWPLVAYLVMRLFRLRGRLALVGAMLASMSAPVVQLMRNEGVDVGFYAYLLLALVAATSGRRFYRRPTIVLAIALGLALGSKSSGPLAVGVGILAFFVQGWLLRRSDGSAGGFGWRLGEAAVAGAVVLALGSWVYTANTLAHGNPVFPMALQLGPLVLPTVDEDQPVYYNRWIRDYGVRPSERLLGAAQRWPRLLLGLEPFDRYLLPFSGGFGPVTTTAFGLLLLLGVVALLRRRAPPLSVAELAFLGLLLFWNLALVSMVSLISAPDTPVDARYQLHLAVVVPLLMLLVARSLPRPGQTAVIALLLGVFVYAGVAFTLGSAVRGWTAVSRTLERGDPLLLYARPRFFPTKAERFFDLVGDDEPIMVGNRGLTYPFFLPTFDRRVHLLSTHGPLNTLAELPPVGTEAETEVLESFRYWTRERVGSAADPEAFASGWRPGVGPYAKAVAEEIGVRFVLVETGAASEFEERSEWRKIAGGDRPDNHRALTLFEYVGADRPAARDGGE